MNRRGTKRSTVISIFVGLVIAVVIAVVMMSALGGSSSSRTTPTQAISGTIPSSTATSTTTTTPSSSLPSGENWVVVGDMAVNPPSQLTVQPDVSGAISQAVMLRGTISVAEIIWAPSAAQNLGQAILPYVSVPTAAGYTAPKVTVTPIIVAGLPGRLVRIDDPGYARTRLIALAWHSPGQVISVSTVATTANAAAATALIRQLAAATAVQMPAS